MKVIMTGGGTGGHIYPAIAIADKIREKQPDADIIFVGTKKGLEKELVPKNGYELKFITVSGISRRNPVKNIRTFMDLAKGMNEAKAIIKEFRPDVVIGTGGYVCGPVVRAAKKQGIRCYVHEQNAFPGLTNKILENYVDKVFISFDAAKEHFKHEEKLLLTGNPVRRKFYVADAAESRKKLGIGEGQFALLCFGGSRGADRINDAMWHVVTRHNGDDNMQIYFVTGKVHYDEIKNRTSELPGGLGENVHLLPYIDEMDVYLSGADLVISRSGALTVSEITVCGKPSIMIPSPNVTGNHQYFNARAVADLGGAILTEEKDLTDDKLLAEIECLMKDKDKLKKMGAAARLAAPKDATEIIYNAIL